LNNIILRIIFYTMSMIKILKPGLFLYECIKIMIIFTVLIIQKNDPGLQTKIVLAAPGALFPIMALFIWLDTNRYRAYMPLFTAGKCISLFLMLGWLITSRQVIMVGSLYQIAVHTEAALFGGDLLALAAVLLMIKNEKDSNAAAEGKCRELSDSEPVTTAEVEEN